MPNLLHQMRKLSNRTQEQLAEAVHTTSQQISRLEKGERNLTLEWMERIAAALEIRPAALIDPVIAAFPEPHGVRKLEDQATELLLLGLWRRMSDGMREALLRIATVHAEDIAKAIDLSKVPQTDDVVARHIATIPTRKTAGESSRKPGAVVRGTQAIPAKITAKRPRPL